MTTFFTYVGIATTLVLAIKVIALLTQRRKVSKPGPRRDRGYFPPL
jgi:hypothetical protein